MNNLVFTHEQANELLPWFVNDTLSPEEFAGVEAHVRQCNACREHLVELRSLRDAVTAGRTTPIIPESDSAELFARIDKQADAGQIPGRLTHWAVAAGLAALAAVMVWQNPTNQVTDPVNREFTPATGNAPGDVAYIFELDISPARDDQRLDQLFRDIGAEIQLDERSIGPMRILVDMESLSFEALTKYAAALEQSPDIDSATPVAVQLPVE